ncbi:serine hydrolase [Robertkochia aurantiaca]|uniref:serine hydrolase n=1 Tax=Robertkochia aurantiaca TaxID=2873700 RepID=UPI001CC9ED65|nr:serine hydrolase [Robertkochia sp. 3YJGBD-33]
MMNIDRLLILALIVIFGSHQLQSQNDHQKKLDQMIRQGIEDWNIPGFAVSVVHEGETIFYETYGVRNIADKTPVDEHTLFTLGSTTKAMIAIGLGMLADEGKLSWEDPVRKHLPSFRLSDPYITEEARIQDLLTHNLGIQPADLLWIIDSVSTEKTIERFQHAPKVYPVRGGFQYNNMMYAIAGEVIGSVSGSHWTEFLREKLFIPLEMTDTKAVSADIMKIENRVTPYSPGKQGPVKDIYMLKDQVGAAGMIWSSIHDMTNYLKFLDQDGIYNGDTIVRSQTFDKLFEPQTIIPEKEFYPTRELTNPNWTTYGLAWFQQDYKGLKVDYHTGSITGLIALAGLVRDKDLAVYVFGNMDHAELRHAVLFKAIDLFVFDDDSTDWHKEIFALYEPSGKEESEFGDMLEKNRIENSSPSLELKAYEGIYVHKMYGEMRVDAVEDSLTITSNDLYNFEMDHLHFNTFISNKNNMLNNKVPFTFNLGDDGKVETLRVYGLEFNKKR